MTGPEVLDIARDAIYHADRGRQRRDAGGLAVGVVISLFQALTQIQEMTLDSCRRSSRSSSPADRAAVHGREAAGDMVRIAARIVGG